jgi:transposase
MARIAEKVILTDKQRNALVQIASSRTHRPDHINRSKIILISSELKQDTQISVELNISRRTIRKWRKRWLRNEAKLTLIDAQEKGIAYNLNTHQSEGLVNLVIKRLNIKLSDEELGIKGKSGILCNMETRSKFLSDTSHRIQFVYTPKHASWLNQVEIWFSILVNRLLKRLSVRSTAELKTKILSFISYFNATMAKTYKWTYRGRVLNA